jgi:hypothetical protein
MRRWRGSSPLGRTIYSHQLIFLAIVRKLIIACRIYCVGSLFSALKYRSLQQKQYFPQLYLTFS